MPSTATNTGNHWGSSTESSRKEHAIEIGVFLFLIVPSMIFSFFAIKHGSVNFTLVAVATILRDIALVCLILFFVWHNDEPVGRIGWIFKNRGVDIVIGIVLFVPLFYFANGVERLLHALGFTVPTTPSPTTLPAVNVGEVLLSFFLVVIVAIAEETIFRGYLILRLKSVTGSTAAAVILSAVIFSLGHGYEGTAGVATVGLMGLIFALVYIWRKSLVAPMIMHFLQDFLVIVLLPVLASGAGKG
jgi:membrane protease YdiL (CAAX protease family)